MRDFRVNLMSIVWTIVIVLGIVQLLFWCLSDFFPLKELWLNYEEAGWQELFKLTFEYFLKLACIWWFIRMEIQLLRLWAMSKQFLKNAAQLEQSAYEAHKETAKQEIIDEYEREHGFPPVSHADRPDDIEAS